MIEWLAIPAIAVGAALIPKKQVSDVKKIQIIFENRKVGIKKDDSYLYPKLYKKHDNEQYSTYLYTLPLGIPSEAFETIKSAIVDGLNKDIEIKYDGLLKIKVYKQKLPEKWSYTDDLLNEGKWEIPIGRNYEGILYHDFDKYPHMLVGGVTRFGKTVLIKEIFYSLLMNQMENVEFYILDLKGGMEFGHYVGIPQVKKVSSDIFESTELLSTIIEDLKGRQKFMRSKQYTNIVDTPIQKRTFIIVDEGAELSPNIVEGDARKYAKFCQAALSEIARIGGALGYRLIFCTQYPTKEAVPMQVKMNIVARLSFIAAAQIASRVILDDIGAEDLPSIPGRAIYKIEKNRTIQVPYIDDKYMFSKLEGKQDDIIKAVKDRKSTNNN
ncbi:FtsK/SpoIIIE domain-containing protein [Heyndrickxia oleronia]|uniref:FtsK/SpoIIIE domain-containing protein n=1 Tax=Heyndrickxia oleronia TaxID=38875 RepID=A0AAW6SRZ0_9BACI|nr:FtsK/SpoIIIE domain-containing protein [Heyndrickxia oleronia]MBU5212209.1 cell division protein FtsK [Heyndrickxia oleronia]MDH5161529.1 FtsK/SpoIIIE domain-containing protein [Heyndrickxia oleronia]